MLIDRFRYKKSLIELWHNVFGDSYSYIELIFNKKYEDSILCFAELEDGEAISAFYLLKNKLYYNSKIYNGFYLYAAATDKKSRGKGVMAKLINEAQLYCKENGYDFISLVPSEESLYGYYSRFCFVNSMYSFSQNRTDSDFFSTVSSDVYYSLRKKYCTDHIVFDEKAFMYAAESLNAAGYKFYSNDKSIFIKNSESDYIEYLSGESDEADRIERYPFGMLYPINPELKRDWKYTDIYMNIALD